MYNHKNHLKGFVGWALGLPQGDRLKRKEISNLGLILLNEFAR